jgi:hypothetical protein
VATASLFSSGISRRVFVPRTGDQLEPNANHVVFQVDLGILDLFDIGQSAANPVFSFVNQDWFQPHPIGTM